MMVVYYSGLRSTALADDDYPLTEIHMSRILLLANLNCDHVLALSEPLKAGGRFYYADHGRRLGGGAANTGIGLVWAGHHAAIALRLGDDDTGDWLLSQALHYQLDCQYVERFQGETGELLILVDSQGERTILRTPRPLNLPQKLPEQGWDLLYVNCAGDAVTDYMQQMLAHTQVIAQYPKGGQERRPCHILVASQADLLAHSDPWQHACQLAGTQLQWLVITQGAAGARAIQGARQIHVAARPVAVVDTTGAGDAFAGGLIHGLASGMTMTQALQSAMSWGAFAVASETSIPSNALRDWLQSGAKIIN